MKVFLSLIESQKQNSIFIDNRFFSQIFFDVKTKRNFLVFVDEYTNNKSV